MASSSSHQMPPSTPQPPAAPPAVPSLPDLAITRAADMAMSPHPDRRAKLRQCIVRLPQAEASTALTLVEQRIEEAVGRLGLDDVLVFDVGGLEDGLRMVHLLEQGSGGEWREMGRFIRLAAIYGLTPNATLPLRLSADALPSRTAFHQLPLAMTLYKTIGHMLTHNGQSLAVQQADNKGAYRIGNVSFRVVPLGDLPAGHSYTDSYKRTDPVIRETSDSVIRSDFWLYRSFSSFLLSALFTWWHHEEGVGRGLVLDAPIALIGLPFAPTRDDPRCRRLRTEAISEQQGGVTVDYRCDRGNVHHANPADYREVVVSGFRPGETVAAYLCEAGGEISLWTTERSVGDRSQPLDVRFPTSMPRWRAVLRHFSLEHDVINRGRVVG
ncbi:unnamed protein product [Vitrella brassicaformis CCMP3155]|uniref:Uncharacterized protein n=1 Tax=Vitrella brassicaformis (strain CCMP3155) TaxID=1169540 RepID=A0A0G4H664_VITBC|nr:unnamed protein product [Vitrella brassicaformis CCMP3155]|eukprot:CEM39196.1 unnamed protein product [Vitrella brassicaformis CCMP3155]